MEEIDGQLQLSLSLKLLPPDQPQQFIGLHFSAHIGCAEEAGGQCALCLVSPSFLIKQDGGVQHGEARIGGRL